MRRKGEKERLPRYVQDREPTATNWELNQCSRNSAADDPLCLLSSQPGDELKLNLGVSLFKGVSDLEKELEVNQGRNTKQQLAELAGSCGSGHRGCAVGIKKSLLSIFNEHSSRFRNFDFFASALEQFHS